MVLLTLFVFYITNKTYSLSRFIIHNTVDLLTLYYAIGCIQGHSTTLMTKAGATKLKIPMLLSPILNTGYSVPYFMYWPNACSKLLATTTVQFHSRMLFWSKAKLNSSNSKVRAKKGRWWRHQEIFIFFFWFGFTMATLLHTVLHRTDRSVLTTIKHEPTATHSYSMDQYCLQHQVDLERL